MQRWFKKHEKELWDAIDLCGSGCTRPTLVHLTILKLIGVGLLELSVHKDKRGNVTDLARVKWELDSDDDEHCYFYENDSSWNQLSL